MEIMVIALKMLLILFFILLFILLLIMFIPFKYFFYGRIDDSIKGKVEIGWTFGLVKMVIYKDEKNPVLRVTIFGGTFFNRKLINSNNVKKQNKSKKIFKIRKIGKELLEEGFKYVIAIFNDIKPKELKITGIYGFDDPSMTGMILGLINMIKGIKPNLQINLEPLFTEKIINIEAQICGDIKVYIICYRTIKVLMKKEIRRSLFGKPKTAETF